MDYQLVSVVTLRNKAKETLIWNDSPAPLSSHSGLTGLNRDSMHRWLAG